MTGIHAHMANSMGFLYKPDNQIILIVAKIQRKVNRLMVPESNSSQGSGLEFGT